MIQHGHAFVMKDDFHGLDGMCYCTLAAWMHTDKLV